MSVLRMENNPRCIFCGTRGESLYRDLSDRLFGVPGTFHLKQCGACRLLWLDPRPVTEDIPKCYEKYYTHLEIPPVKDEQVSRPLAPFRDALRFAILCGHYRYRHLHNSHVWCRLGPLLACVPFLRYRAVYDDLRERFPRYVARRDTLLVDIGCGRGDFLKRMKDLGWNVLGIEPDVASAALAQKRGIPVINSTLENAGLAEGSVDQITMQHVIEHLPDPVAAINECFRLLKGGGRLVIYTPNSGSLGHRRFESAWRGLEPPRHLFIFSPRSTEFLLKKSSFRNVRIKTASALAGRIFDSSRLISNHMNFDGNASALPQRGRNFFAIKEVLLCMLGLPYGEEIEVIACK